MQFIYPLFLAGLLSLLIPVIIHLFHFRKYKKVYFSNVQFLKSISQKQASRRNLKQRAILAARMLALAFLVLAFSKPFLTTKSAISAGKQRVVSIFVDNSYSMQTVNREGPLLDEARRSAKEIASGFNLNDRYQLLTQDFEGKHQRLLNRDEFDDEVDKVKLSPQSRTIAQIIARQQTLLNTQPGAIKSGYVISDFQKNMLTSAPVKGDRDIAINLVRLNASRLPNVAVDSVWMLGAVHRPDESEKLVVRVHNYAEAKAEKVPLKLLIKGNQKAIGSFTLNAREIQNDTLSFSGLQAGWQKAEVQLQDNPITFDNQFYFTFDVEKQLPLLLINGGLPNKFLQAVFASDQFFAPTTVTDGNVNYAGLAKYPMIIISDVKAVSTGLAQQLNNYVAKGGVLMVFPPDMADAASYKALLQPISADYPDKVVIENTRVAKIDIESPVFKNTFERVPQNPDLPVVSKYYHLNGSVTGQNLMEMTARIPFLTAYPYKKGKTFLWTVPLDESYSNLPRHALLVPTLYRIALLSGHDQPLFYTIGQQQAVQTMPIQLNAEQVLKMQKGSQTIIPDLRQQDGSSVLYFAEQVREPGTYDLKKQDSTIASLAFNNNRSESDLSYADNAELKTKLPASSVVQAEKVSLKDQVALTNKGTELWKLCIILALVCLAAEILLIRFYKPDGQIIGTAANLQNIPT